MSRHLQHEIEGLKTRILKLSTLVENNLQKAVYALMEYNPDMAKQIISGDEEIDRMEVDLEEECLKVLALHQPVAVDLRFIIAILKINNDLERIGDLGVNLAERVLFLCKHPKLELPLDFTHMADLTKKMLKDCLSALINLDADLARKVCMMDDSVDRINREMFDLIHNEMIKSPKDIFILSHLLSCSKHLERVADHATNIAEDVVYMVEGKIIRHKPENFIR